MGLLRQEMKQAHEQAGDSAKRGRKVFALASLPQFDDIEHTKGEMLFFIDDCHLLCFLWCATSDSNRHCRVFEARASYQLG